MVLDGETEPATERRQIAYDDAVSMAAEAALKDASER